MNDIIKKIEAGQLKEKVDDFRVGDTVRVSALIKDKMPVSFRLQQR